MWRFQSMSLVAGAVLLWQFMSTMSVGAQTVDILSPKPEPTVGASVAAVAPAPFIVPALPPMFLPEPVPVPPPVLEVPIAAPVSSPPPPVVPLQPITFDYSNGQNGPAHWGDLKAEWSLCKTGIAQSPLAITPNIMITDPNLGELNGNYTSKPILNATILHNGHGIEVDVPSGVGVVKIYNVTYKLKQFHFHHPSEHAILDYRFPLELHLVHESDDNRTAVISMLFVYGNESAFLAQMFNKLPSYKNPGVKFNLGPIKLLKLGHQYGRYRGSITTPPCTEKVIWTLMLWNWPTVSDAQLQQLQAALPMDNARTISFPSRGRKFHINHTPKWMKEQLRGRSFLPNF